MRVVVDTTKLKAIRNGSGDAVQDILRKLAQDMEGDVKMSFNAQSPAPAGEPPGVDTGNLKNSVLAEPDGNDWVVGVGAPYAIHLEYGTLRMSARPFMRPAFERTIRSVGDDLLTVVE